MDLYIHNFLIECYPPALATKAETSSCFMDRLDGQFTEAHSGAGMRFTDPIRDLQGFTDLLPTQGFTEVYRGVGMTPIRDLLTHSRVY